MKLFLLAGGLAGGASSIVQGFKGAFGGGLQAGGQGGASNAVGAGFLVLSQGFLAFGLAKLAKEMQKQALKQEVQSMVNYGNQQTQKKAQQLNLFSGMRAGTSYKPNNTNPSGLVSGTFSNYQSYQEGGKVRLDTNALDALLDLVALTKAQRESLKSAFLPYAWDLKEIPQEPVPWQEETDVVSGPDFYEIFPSYWNFYDYLVLTDRNSDDYGSRAFYLDPYATREWVQREIAEPGKAHFPGRYKMPNHMTYGGPEGENWREENGVWHYYVPEDHREGGRYGHTYDDYIKYWNENERGGSVLHYGDKTYIVQFAQGGALGHLQELPTEEVHVGGNVYSVWVASSDEDVKLGLQGVTELLENEGMLFDFGEEGNHEMWMKNTSISLDLVFLNEDLLVTKVITRRPLDETLIGQPGTWYVLEVNANSGIKEGDTLSFTEDEPYSVKYTMKVLAPDGSTQMELQGGERIVSRKETKVLIRKAKKANKAKSDAAYAGLGKYMFKVLLGQDERKPEYVDSPK